MTMGEITFDSLLFYFFRIKGYAFILQTVYLFCTIFSDSRGVVLSDLGITRTFTEGLYSVYISAFVVCDVDQVFVGNVQFHLKSIPKVPLLVLPSKPFLLSSVVNLLPSVMNIKGTPGKVEYTGATVCCHSLTHPRGAFGSREPDYTEAVCSISLK